MRERLVLVPGLWMPAAAMALFAARLRRAYEVDFFGYSGRGAHDENVDARGGQ